MGITKNEKKITLSLSDGSSAEILFFGATVISWKSPDASSQVKERLFLSSKSALDGSKPVRGGIPIVFPFFANASRPEHQKMSSHGFARSSIWELGKVVEDTEESVSVQFKLNPTPSITAVYESLFELVYTVKLTTTSLTTQLEVKNPSTTSTLVHQALFHNYLAVSSSSSVLVTPLKGLTYIDKVDNFIEKVETRDAVDVKKFTDNVYKSAGGKYKATWEGGGLELKVEGFGDVVLWNPQEEAGKKIGDMEDGGWERYVCVEPGIASYWNEISPGETWTGSQVLTPIKL